MAAGKNENKEKKKVNGGGRKSCGSGKGGNFYFCFYFYFFFEVGNGLDGAEMVVCGDEGKYLKKILFPGRFVGTRVPCCVCAYYYTHVLRTRA